MKKIIAFTGSNNSQSINRQLLQVATNQLTDFDVEIIDLRDYELPIYSMDIETDGFPDNIQKLVDKLSEAEGYVISSPEHNGSVTAFFKNIMDWLSRVEKNYLGNKPLLLLSTSPGGYGGANSLAALQGRLKYVGGDTIASFSLGEFYDKFNSETLSITDQDKKSELQKAIEEFTKAYVAKV